jgi:hypothetical protein
MRTSVEEHVDAAAEVPGQQDRLEAELLPHITAGFRYLAFVPDVHPLAVPYSCELFFEY